MDFNLITFHICKLIPVTCDILEIFHQKLTFVPIVYAKKSPEKLLKIINKIAYISQCKGVRPVVPMEIGCKLAFSGLFDANRAMYDNPGLSNSIFMNLTPLGSKMGGVGS